MSDIIVFDTNFPVDQNPAIGDRRQRQSGMATLGLVFNKYFMDEDLTPEEIVNKTIREIIGMPLFRVTYLDKDNVLSIKTKKNKAKNKYIVTKADGSTFILKLKASKDGKETDSDGEDMDVMHIAVTNGHNNLLAPNNYLATVLGDVGAAVSDPARQYLLGTITYRRCR